MTAQTASEPESATRTPFAALLGEHDRVVAPSFDGTPIGAMAHGAPYAPVVLAANGLGARMEAFAPVCSPFYDRFRFVTWDYRGLYTSGRPIAGYDALRVEDHAKDALFIMDALNVPKVHLMGWSLGVQVALEVYRRAPERVASIIFVCGVSGQPLTSAFTESIAPRALMRHLSPALVNNMQRFDALSMKTLLTFTASPALVPTLVRMGLLHHAIDADRFRLAARQLTQLDLHLYLELLRRGERHDASDVLSEIAVRTVVVAGTKDVMTPFSRQRRMAERIPNAEFFPVYGGTHFAPMEMPERIVRALNRHFADAAKQNEEGA